MFDSDDLDDDDNVPPTKRRAMGGSVLARFGLNTNQREYNDYDDDNLGDMEAGYDEVERKNERAYVVVFLPFPPARVLWNTDYNLRPQFTRSKAGRPDRSRRRGAARRGETEAEDGKDGWWWSCLSIVCRLATYSLDIFLDTNGPCLMFGLRFVVVPLCLL